MSLPRDADDAYTHDDGPADGSRHGGKLSTSPHSAPLTE